MKIKSSRNALAVSLFVAVAGCASLVQTTAPAIATVVKLTGIDWFNRMELGIKSFGDANTNVRAFQTGPAQADAAQQVRLIEDLVARKVSAIAVVPVDPSSLEPILKRAMDEGIKVVTHESESQINTHVDIEAFDNTEFGARLNERLAACMGGTGKWTSFVGSQREQTHLQWASAGTANAARNHPGMVLVDAMNESGNDVDRAYAKTREILRKHPDIKGFQGYSSTDALGIGRAIEEAGLQDKTCVVGTGLPRASAKLLASGAIDVISFWDPRDAGIVMNKVALMLIEGRPVSDGADLGVSGYNNVRVSKGPGRGLVLKGQAWVDVDRLNHGQYPF